MEEYHVLLLNSCIGMGLCIALIAVMITQKLGGGGFWALVFAIFLFSGTWLSLLLHIVIFLNNELLIKCAKGSLLAGCFLFIVGFIGFIKVVAIKMRMKDNE